MSPAARMLARCSFVLVLLSAYSATATPAGAAPYRVALVQWHDLPPAVGPLAPLGVASALRAAGYPAVPQLSKSPFTRASDVLKGIDQKHMNAVGLATPIPIGVGGPGLHSTAQASTGYMQRKLQQQQQQPAAAVRSVGGFESTSSGTPAGTTGLAAGPRHLLHVAGGLVTVYNLTASSSSGSGIQVAYSTRQSVALSSLMAAVSDGCEGVYDPSAVFDAAANRFLVSATCGGQGLVLLATSGTSDATGTWFVSALVADGVGTALACTSPAVESALADYTQVSFNADGVFITYKSICPSNATHDGVGLLALPKWALYRGMPSYQYPIYTGAELSAALGSADSSASLAAAAAAAAGRETRSCAQLVPVRPQEAADVGLGSALFVCELISTSGASATGGGRSVGVFALLDTASLWQYGGQGTETNAPLLVGESLQLEAAAPPVTGLPLRQPHGAQPLQLGTRPRGFWNGAAVLSGGQIYLATSTIVLDKSSASYSRRPAIAWAQLSSSISTTGTDSCPQSRAGAASRQAWDGSRDWTKEWGLQAAAATSSAAAPSAPNNSSRTVHAAGVLTPVLGAAQFAAVGLSQLGAAPCTCYGCYWGGQYYRYGGYNGGALAGTGYGFASSGYFFQQGAMSRCQSFCTKCWYYGYPGHGFGNVGEDKSFLDLQAAAPFAANISGATPIEGSVLSINTAEQAQATSLFAPCSRSGSLDVHLQRQGLLQQGGAEPLGLVFPALAVGRSREVLVTFSYAGPGEARSGTPAYLGVGAAVVQPGSNVSTVAVLQPGRGTIRPAALAGGVVPPSGAWAELSAAAVQSGSGTLFTLTHFASSAAAEVASVGSWINQWQL